jgi:hypothetical protein
VTLHLEGYLELEYTQEMYKLTDYHLTVNPT